MCFCVLVMPFTAYRFLNACNYFDREDVLCVGKFLPITLLHTRLVCVCV